MAIQVVERDLERLQGLWEDGLSEAYRSYLETVGGFEPSAQPRLALAAALVEVGIRLQGLGGRAAAPPSLLLGDLCLARSSRLLAEAAPQSVQVAFARAIEEMSSAAAAGQDAPDTRDLLMRAFEAG
jgi:hypothetical protein